jgi:hypothetical protein
MYWQDSNYQTGKYTVLDVDVDNMRLSKFIETKLNCKYEDEKAFFDVTENEGAAKIEVDLLYCKKILRPKKNEVAIHYKHNTAMAAQWKFHS